MVSDFEQVYVSKFGSDDAFCFLFCITLQQNRGSIVCDLDDHRIVIAARCDRRFICKGGENCKCRAAEVEPISCGVLCDGNSESGRLRHQAFESRRLWTRSNPQCIWVEVSEHGWQSTDVVAMGVRQRNGIQMGKAS